MSMVLKCSGHFYAMVWGRKMSAVLKDFTLVIDKEVGGQEKMTQGKF